MTDLPEYRLERLFKAPIDLVWRAWTDPEILQRWYGPGVETIIHEFDLRPGGVWKNEMRWDNGGNFQLMAFQEVAPPERLVWHHQSVNEQWEVASNPMMPDWPRVLLTRVMFNQQGNETSVVLTQTPHQATEAEVQCFAEAMANMDHGWGSGYAILDEILAELS